MQTDNNSFLKKLNQLADLSESLSSGSKKKGSKKNTRTEKSKKVKDTFVFITNNLNTVKRRIDAQHALTKFLLNTKNLSVAIPKILQIEIEAMQKNVEKGLDLKENDNIITHNCKPKSLDVSIREYEIIFHLIKGLSSKEIASKIKLSLHTVNAHRRSVLEKTKCKNTAELISFVLEKFRLENL